MADKVVEKVEKPPCHVCRQVGRTKRIPCKKCNHVFHATCTTMSTVLDGNEVVTVCGPCLKQANLPADERLRSRTSSMSSNCSGTRTSTPTGDESNDSTLAMILTRLTSLENNMNSRFTRMEATMQSQTEALEKLPSLFERMDATENRMKLIESEQAGLKEMLKESLCHAAPSKENTSKIEELSRQITKLSTQQARLSSEILISGIHYSDVTDLRLLSLAVLRIVHPGVRECDIVSARPLLAKRLSTERESQGSGSSNSPNRSPPIIISLSSPSLSQEVIQGKIKKGKLHSSAIDKDMLVKAGLSTLPPSLINMSEFLPRQIHELRTVVRQKSKEEGFRYFIKNGEIFARRKDDQHPTLISTKEDLDNFLSLSLP